MRSGSETSAFNDGFTASLAGEEARRTLHLSLAVVVAMAIGLVSAGMTIGKSPIDARRSTVESHAPVAAMQAETTVSGAKPI